jgi:hypothetical protein
MAGFCTQAGNFTFFNGFWQFQVQVTVAIAAAAAFFFFFLLNFKRMGANTKSKRTQCHTPLSRHTQGLPPVCGTNSCHGHPSQAAKPELCVVNASLATSTSTPPPLETRGQLKRQFKLTPQVQYYNLVLTLPDSIDTATPEQIVRLCASLLQKGEICFDFLD